MSHSFETLPAPGDRIAKIETWWEPRSPNAGEEIVIKANLPEIAEIDQVPVDVTAGRLEMIGRRYGITSINNRLMPDNIKYRDMAMLKTPEGLVEIPVMCCEPVEKPESDSGWSTFTFESGKTITVPVRRNE